MNMKKSYTLIEILIASAIFSAIIVITIGTFSGSISFSGAATEDRVTRGAAQTFNDWLTRQIRATNTMPITLSSSGPAAVTTMCLISSDGGSRICGALPDYKASGFLFIDAYNLPLNSYDIADGGTINGVGGIIIPKPDTPRYWMYIGTPCAGESLPMVRQTVAAFDTVPPNPCGANWTSAGQILPAEVSVKNLKFYGINPKLAKFDTNGNLTDYGALSQPYISWSMQMYPTNAPDRVTTYQTTLTSRDYSFAFPVCTTGNCQ
ncbi:MAG: type II secretion system protein [Patescibacteria group bacterium]|jgi:type II secretory pathway pseudopilin PulG